MIIYIDSTVRTGYIFFHRVLPRLNLYTRCHVEDVGDPARERDHDDHEGHEEEEDVLEHVVHAEDDRPEVLGRDANLERQGGMNIRSNKFKNLSLPNLEAQRNRYCKQKYCQGMSVCIIINSIEEIQ